MKFLLFLVLVGVLVGARSNSLRWPQLTVLFVIVATLAGWQAFNIVFRYIGVE